MLHNRSMLLSNNSNECLVIFDFPLPPIIFNSTTISVKKGATLEDYGWRFGFDSDLNMDENSEWWIRDDEFYYAPITNPENKKRLYRYTPITESIIVTGTLIKVLPQNQVFEFDFQISPGSYTDFHDFYYGYSKNISYYNDIGSISYTGNSFNTLEFTLGAFIVKSDLSTDDNNFTWYLLVKYLTDSRVRGFTVDFSPKISIPYKDDTDGSSKTWERSRFFLDSDYSRYVDYHSIWNAKPGKKYFQSNRYHLKLTTD